VVAVVSAVKLTRDAVARSIAQERRFRVALSVTNLDDVSGDHDRPDVILVDGTTIAPVANRTTPEGGGFLAVFGLSPDNRRLILHWMVAGAHACVERDADRNEVFRALESAKRGLFHLSASLLEAIVHEASRPADDPRDLVALTPRESEVAALMNEGLSNKQIAGRLRISVSTVKNHVHSVLRRLHGSDRKHLASSTLSREIALARATPEPVE
jgi:DNA-binding NarL/FixJ family response regulator